MKIEDLTPFFLMLRNIKPENVCNFCITNIELKLLYGIDLFEDLLIQGVNRKINNENVYFIGIKNIVLKDEYRGMNILTTLIDSLETSKVPIFIDDIINHRLFSFFYQRGYINLKYNSSYGWKRCMYKINY